MTCICEESFPVAIDGGDVCLDCDEWMEDGN